MIAIGVIDTYGYVSTVEALDICLKTAEVRLVDYQKVTGGIVSFTVTGDVASVSSAVQAGVAAAVRLGGYRHHTIIARIDEQTNKLFAKPAAPTPVIASSAGAKQPVIARSNATKQPVIARSNATKQPSHAAATPKTVAAATPKTVAAATPKTVAATTPETEAAAPKAAAKKKPTPKKKP
jgi:microcompartment protein CcmL/EutN